MPSSSPNGVPSIVPIVVSSTSSAMEKNLADLLAPYVKDEENAFIISTDFCHWGLRFNYTAYTSSPEATTIKKLGPYSKLPSKTPIYKSIEYLDRKGMEVLSTGSSEKWDEYNASTKNTICGSTPLSVLLKTLEEASNVRIPMNGFANTEERDSWGKLKWIGYSQSGKVTSPSDSSVSYGSGYAVI